MDKMKPPVWFWIVAGLLLLWGLAGCFSLYLHIAFGPAMNPNATDWDRAYFAALPSWFVWVYVVAVGGGLLGSGALVLRSRLAKPLYLASLAGVVVQFGYVFLGTDLLAHKSVAETVPFPLLIFAIALVQIWFAGLAARRGWIG
jgi:hypothetical protein